MIKVIEGLLPWQVMKRASEGDAWAWSHCGSWVKGDEVMQNSVIQKIAHHITNRREVAIIDTSTPEIDWDKFDWDFFNQYGGVPAVSSEGAEHLKQPREHPDYNCRVGHALRESPFYYWPGGEQPVPDNVEVEVVLRDGKSREYPLTTKAAKLDWATRAGHMADIIAFKLTGKLVK